MTTDHKWSGWRKNTFLYTWGEAGRDLEPLWLGKKTKSNLLLTGGSERFWFLELHTSSLGVGTALNKTPQRKHKGRRG